jgi:putative SOS response-associated peptidase YedK
MDTFSIVTTKANSLMAEIHNKKKRMPLILPDELAWEWIQDGLSLERIAEITHYAFPAGKMDAHTIAKEFRTMDDPTEAFEYDELPTIKKKSKIES